MLRTVTQYGVFTFLGAAIILLLSFVVERGIKQVDDMLVPCQHGTSYVQGKCRCDGTPFDGNYCSNCKCEYGSCSTEPTTPFSNSDYGCRCPTQSKRFGFLCDLCNTVDEECKGACKPEFFGNKCERICHADLAYDNNNSVCNTMRSSGGSCSTCHGHGTCNGGLCDCDDNWFNDARKECVKTCPGTPICSGHGTCKLYGDTPGCLCENGWNGPSCDIPCPGIETTGVPCNHKGICNVDFDANTASCDCNEKFRGPDCSIECPGTIVACNGHGTCDDTGACTCQTNVQWSLPSCKCSDELTCSAKGTCNTQEQCECFGNNGGQHCMECKENWHGENCDLFCDPYLKANTSDKVSGQFGCFGHGTCLPRSGAMECTCNLDVTKRINVKGAVNDYTSFYDHNMNCGECIDSYFPKQKIVNDHGIPSEYTVPCEGECLPATCNNRGVCNHNYGIPGASLCHCTIPHLDDTSFCTECEANWYPLDFGRSSFCNRYCVASGTLPAECDGTIDCVQCNGHGTCTEEGDCLCTGGYTGEECQILCTSSNGKICGGHGTCESNEIQQLMEHEFEAEGNIPLFSCTCDPQDPVDADSRIDWDEKLALGLVNGTLDDPPRPEYFGQTCDYQCIKPPWEDADECNGMGNCSVITIRDPNGGSFACTADSDCQSTQVQQVVSGDTTWTSDKGPFCHKQDDITGCEKSTDDCYEILLKQRPRKMRSEDCVTGYSIVEVSSGAPDMSVSEAECQAYGESISKWQTAHDWGNGNPMGCFEIGGNVYFNKAASSTDLCQVSKVCLQKANTCLPALDAYDWHQYCQDVELKRQPAKFSGCKSVASFCPAKTIPTFCKTLVDLTDGKDVSYKLNLTYEYNKRKYPFLISETYRSNESTIEHDEAEAEFKSFVSQHNVTHKLESDFCSKHSSRYPNINKVRENKQYLCNGAIVNNTSCNGVLSESQNNFYYPFTVECVNSIQRYKTYEEATLNRASGCKIVEVQKDIVYSNTTDGKEYIDAMCNDIQSKFPRCNNPQPCDFSPCKDVSYTCENSGTKAICSTSGNLNSTCLKGVSERLGFNSYSCEITIPDTTCPKDITFNTNVAKHCKDNNPILSRAQTMGNNYTRAITMGTYAHFLFKASDAVSTHTRLVFGDAIVVFIRQGQIQLNEIENLQSCPITNQQCNDVWAYTPNQWYHIELKLEPGKVTMTRKDTGATITKNLLSNATITSLKTIPGSSVATFKEIVTENDIPSPYSCTYETCNLDVSYRQICSDIRRNVEYPSLLEPTLVPLDVCSTMHANTRLSITENYETTEKIYELDWDKYCIFYDALPEYVTLGPIIVNATSGTPDLSLSEAECQQYATNNGYSFASNAYSGYPLGCLLSAGSAVSVFWNTQDQNVQCGSDPKCLQKSVGPVPITDEPIIVTGGVPDLSMSQAECEAYAVAEGYTWYGTYSGATNPNGCFLQYSTVYYNTNGGSCALNVLSKCIQKSIISKLENYHQCREFMDPLDGDKTCIDDALDFDWTLSCSQLNDAVLPTTLKNACPATCYNHLLNVEQDYCSDRAEIFSGSKVVKDIAGCTTDWYDYCLKDSKGTLEGKCSAVECSCDSEQFEGISGESCQLHCPLAFDGSACAEESKMGICTYTSTQKEFTNNGGKYDPVWAIEGECQCFLTEGTRNCDIQCKDCNTDSYGSDLTSVSTTEDSTLVFAANGNSHYVYETLFDPDIPVCSNSNITLERSTSGHLLRLVKDTDCSQCANGNWLVYLEETTGTGDVTMTSAECQAYATAQSLAFGSVSCSTDGVTHPKGCYKKTSIVYFNDCSQAIASTACNEPLTYNTFSSGSGTGSHLTKAECQQQANDESFSFDDVVALGYPSTYYPPGCSKDPNMFYYSWNSDFTSTYSCASDAECIRKTTTTSCIKKGPVPVSSIGVGFKEVTSAVPDMSVSQAACEAYASSISATWNGVKTWGAAPPGCIKHPTGTTYTYNLDTNGQWCGVNNYKCIEKVFLTHDVVQGSPLTTQLTAGTYYYLCTAHPEMVGKLTVGDCTKDVKLEEVTSGLPDLSVSEQECEDYGTSLGLTMGVGNMGGSYPDGCTKNTAGTDIYFSTLNHGNSPATCGSIGRNCIQKGNPEGQIAICDNGRGVCDCLPPFTYIDSNTEEDWRGKMVTKLERVYNTGGATGKNLYRIRQMQGKESYIRSALQKMSVNDSTLEFTASGTDHFVYNGQNDPQINLCRNYPYIISLNAPQGGLSNPHVLTIAEEEFCNNRGCDGGQWTLLPDVSVISLPHDNSREWTFTRNGIYYYYGEHHNKMVGKIVVGDCAAANVYDGTETWETIYETFLNQPTSFWCFDKPCQPGDINQLGNLDGTSARYNFDCNSQCPGGGIEASFGIPCSGNGYCGVTGDCICDPAKYIVGTSSAGFIQKFQIIPGIEIEETKYSISKLDKTGYRGDACDTICPGFDPELSDMSTICNGNGKCDLAGQCACNVGYIGEECQYKCPMSEEADNLCSGHGTCELTEIAAAQDMIIGQSKNCTNFANFDICTGYAAQRELTNINVAGIKVNAGDKACTPVELGSCTRWPEYQEKHYYFWRSINDNTKPSGCVLQGFKLEYNLADTDVRCDDTTKCICQEDIPDKIYCTEYGGKYLVTHELGGADYKMENGRWSGTVETTKNTLELAKTECDISSSCVGVMEDPPGSQAYKLFRRDLQLTNVLGASSESYTKHLKLIDSICVTEDGSKIDPKTNFPVQRALHKYNDQCSEKQVQGNCNKTATKEECQRYRGGVKMVFAIIASNPGRGESTFFITETQCREYYDSQDLTSSYVNTFNDATFPSGCIYNTGAGATVVKWNLAENGAECGDQSWHCVVQQPQYITEINTVVDPHGCFIDQFGTYQYNIGGLTTTSIVSSGTPDLSMSQSECQQYATGNGLTWHTPVNGYFGSSYPQGCVKQKYGNDVRYNLDSSTGDCSNNFYDCVQKSNVPVPCDETHVCQCATDTYKDTLSQRCKTVAEKPMIKIEFFQDRSTPLENKMEMDCQFDNNKLVVCAQCSCFTDYVNGLWAGFECETCALGHGKSQCREKCPEFDGETRSSMCSGNGICMFGSRISGEERIFQKSECICGQDGEIQERQPTESPIVVATYPSKADARIDYFFYTPQVGTVYGNKEDAMAGCNAKNEVSLASYGGFCFGIINDYKRSGSAFTGSLSSPQEAQENSWYLHIGYVGTQFFQYAVYYEKTLLSGSTSSYSYEDYELYTGLLPLPKETSCLDDVSIILQGKDQCNHFSLETDSCDTCHESWTGKNCRNKCQKCLLGGSCDNRPSEEEYAKCVCPSGSGTWDKQCCPVGYAVGDLITWYSKPQGEIDQIRILSTYDEMTENELDGAFYCKKCPGVTDTDWLKSSAAFKACSGPTRGECLNEGGVKLTCSCKMNEDSAQIWKGRACACDDSITTGYSSDANIQESTDYGCLIPSGNTGKCPEPSVSNSIWFIPTIPSSTTWSPPLYTPWYPGNPWKGIIAGEIVVKESTCNYFSIYGQRLCHNGEGSCASNSECAEGLQCFIRSNGEKKIGYDTSRISVSLNFCYDPTPGLIGCAPNFERYNAAYGEDVLDQEYYWTGTTFSHSNTLGYYIPMIADAANALIINKRKHKCPPGTFGVKDDYHLSSPKPYVCVKCPPGTYGSSFGATGSKKNSGILWSTSNINHGCSGCPTGKTSFISGATSSADCISCDDGQTSQGGVCVNCACGKYEENGVCKNCAAGYYSAPKQTSCTQCAAGKYVADSCGGQNYVTNCQSCPAGKKSDDDRVCVNCPKGSYQGQAGTTTCFDCNVGKFQNNEGGTSCKTCGLAHPYYNYAYVGDSTDRSKCKYCGGGYYYPDPSGPMGTYDTDACLMCTAGKYDPGYRRTSCPSCPGCHTSNAGATSCTVEPAVYAGWEISSKECVGWYSSEWNVGSYPSATACAQRCYELVPAWKGILWRSSTCWCEQNGGKQCVDACQYHSNSGYNMWSVVACPTIPGGRAWGTTRGGYSCRL